MKLSPAQLTILSNYFADKPVVRAYVFGSYARGDADEKSDIDLLIDWDYTQQIGWNYAGYWTELKQLLNKEIDFVSAKWVHPALAERINSNKQLVYERKAE